jgi:hypothetical protein
MLLLLNVRNFGGKDDFGVASNGITFIQRLVRMGELNEGKRGGTQTEYLTDKIKRGYPIDKINELETNRRNE